MRRQFEIIHFVPDPVSGARVPMGAVIHGENSFRVVRSNHLPGPDCLGSRRAARLLNLLIDDLESLQSPDEISIKLGPQVLVEEPQTIPSDVQNPVNWVEKHILPQGPETPQGKTSSPRRPTRSTEGKRFLEKYDVDQFVRSNFKPQKHLGEAGDELRHLDKVSQWVAGDGKLLLMEPLVPRRPNWEGDLTKVNTIFSAYRYHVDNGMAGHDGELIAYMLPGGTDDQRTEMRRTLQSATDVVDTDSAYQLNAFLDEVRTIGDKQSEFDM